MRLTKPLALFVPFTLIYSGCGSRGHSDSGLDGLAQVNVSTEAPVYARQVLIYYSNETVAKGAYGESYSKIVSALKSSGDVLADLGIPEKSRKKTAKDLEEYGRRVEDDKGCLASLIDFEVQNIQKNICDNPKNKNLGLAVFRSTQMQEGRFMFCGPSQGAQIVEFAALSKPAFKQVMSKNPVAESNPASFSGTLLAALNQTVAVFDMRHKKTSLNLVIRSHGLTRDGAKLKDKTLTDLDSILVSPRIPVMWDQLPGKSERDKKKALVKLFLDNIKKLGRVPRSTCPSTETMQKSFALLGSEGLAAEGFSAEGFSAEGFSAEGFSAEGFSAEGFSAEGFSAEGFSAEGFSAEGFSAEGFSAEGLSPKAISAARLGSGVGSSEGFSSEDYKALGQGMDNANGWITKRFFLELLEKSKYSYPVVLTESCDSFWGKVIEDSGIRLTNVKSIIGAQEKTAANPNASTVDYLNVNYNRLFKGYFENPTKPFSEFFIKEILKK